MPANHRRRHQLGDRAGQGDRRAGRAAAAGGTRALCVQCVRGVQRGGFKDFKHVLSDVSCKLKRAK